MNEPHFVVFMLRMCTLHNMNIASKVADPNFEAESDALGSDDEKAMDCSE